MRTWEIELPDGTRLVHPYKLKHISGLDAKKRILPVHPRFRIIATGQTGSGTQSDSWGGMSWISPDIMSSFHFLQMPLISLDERCEIVRGITGSQVPQPLYHFLKFIHEQEDRENPDISSIATILDNWKQSLCLSSMVRITKAVANGHGDVRNLVAEVVMESFLPQKEFEIFQDICSKADLKKNAGHSVDDMVGVALAKPGSFGYGKTLKMNDFLILKSQICRVYPAETLVL